MNSHFLFSKVARAEANDVNNYRGISLLNVLGKMFSFVLNKRLQKWCDECSLIPESQAGFRTSYSIMDNVFTLQSLIQKYIKPGWRFYVFDFYKAFDWVDRAKLWLIMRNLGCSGPMYSILQNMYKSVVSCVKVRVEEHGNNRLFNFHITEYFQCTSGVKQGCVLSPLLFSLFISQLEKDLFSSGAHGVQLLSNDEDVLCLLYADDLSLIDDNVRDLQRKIGILQTFCTHWGLKVNVDKSKIVVFRNGGYLRRSEKWFWEGKILETVSYYSYLGMLFSSRLCWTRTLEDRAHKGLRIVSHLRRLFKKFQGLDFTIAKNIFDIKIKPMLLYGAEIWGTQNRDTIDHVQITYWKAFLGLGKGTPNCLVLQEVGRVNLCTDYKYRAI